MKRSNEHHLIQCQIINWTELMGFPYNTIYAIPNAGKRSVRTGAALKREGLKPGIPDLCLPVARGEYHALYIEIKYGKDDLSDEQKEVIENLHNIGNCVRVCRTADDGIEIIKSYVKLGEYK